MNYLIFHCVSTKTHTFCISNQCYRQTGREQIPYFYLPNCRKARNQWDLYNWSFSASEIFWEETTTLNFTFSFLCITLNYYNLSQQMHIITSELQSYNKNHELLHGSNTVKTSRMLGFHLYFDFWQNCLLYMPATLYHPRKFLGTHFC